jgi:hypothetical protein
MDVGACLVRPAQHAGHVVRTSDSFHCGTSGFVFSKFVCFRFSRKAVVERVQFVFFITEIYGFWAGNVMMIHGYRKVKEGLMDFSGFWIMCAPEVKRLGDFVWM